MKSVLSVMLCLALLLSSLAFAEANETDVSEAVSYSKLLTIDDIHVSISGEEYELPVVANMGIAADEDSVLLDFGLDYNSDTLFPVQVKLEEDGAALCIGNSSTAYVFSAALLDSLELEYTDLFESLGLSGETESTGLTEEEFTEAFETIWNTYITAEVQETTYEDRPAEHIQGSLDSENLYAMVDDLLNISDAGNSEYVFSSIYSYLLLFGDVSGLYISDTDSQVTNAATFVHSLGYEITCDYDVVSNDIGVTKADLTFSFSDGETTLPFPITLCIDENGVLSFEGLCSQTENDVTTQWLLQGSISQDTLNLKIELSDDAENLLSVTFDSVENEDGTIVTDSVAAGNLVSTAVNFNFNVEEHTTITGDDQDSNFTFAVTSGDFDLALSLHMGTQDAQIEDRIAACKEKRLDTEEDLTNTVNTLSMRLMSLAGDLETLMNDTVVSEIINAFNDLTTETETETGEYYDVYDSADELPFEVPKFTYLSSDFELASENYYTYHNYGTSTSYASLIYVDPDTLVQDEDSYYYEGEIQIDIAGPYAISEFYTLDDEGAVVSAEMFDIDHPQIVEYDSGDIGITFFVDDINYTITIFANTLSLDEIPALLNGIVWGAATETAGKAA